MPTRTTNRLAELARQRLIAADIVVGGSRPWDVQLKHARDADFFCELVAGGTLPLGEFFETGEWNCAAVDQFFERLLGTSVGGLLGIRAGIELVRASRELNLQTGAKAFEVGEHHYDLGDDWFGSFLDPDWNYSCGYRGWGAVGLPRMQIDRRQLICYKTELRSGQRVFEFGCGWGGFALYAAEFYDVEVVGITVSRNQADKTNQRARAKKLPVRAYVMNYEDMTKAHFGQFDVLVSIGMMEHLGQFNLDRFVDINADLLEEQGRILHHLIGGRGRADPWLHKYIFRNGVLLTRGQLETAFTRVFHIWDWHDFGEDYDPTLMAWSNRLTASYRSDANLRKKYGERTYRRFIFFFNFCAALSRLKRTHLWQLVLSKHLMPSGYIPVR
jgi:cyclopropane-fatty-acyl-phospholipid synthase